MCGLSAGEVLPAVESLLEKSLIRRLPGDEETAEFSMLESLREFAAEQLASHAETEETRAGHARHYAALAAQFEAAIGLPEERAWVLRAGRHHADLRAALEYCLGAGRISGRFRWPPRSAGTTTPVATSFMARRWWTRSSPWPPARTSRPVTAMMPQRAAWTACSSWAGFWPGRQGKQPVPRICCSGHLSAAKGVTICATRRSPALFSDMLPAPAASGMRRPSWHQRAEANFRKGGNTQGVAWARHDLGLLARDRGDLDNAAVLLRASLRDFRELDYAWAVAWSAWGLGTTLTVQGRLEEACSLLAEALRIYIRVNDPRGVAQCQEALAYVASEQAHFESAARLIGAAAALRARVAARPPDAEQARNSAVEQVLVRALGPQDADRLIHAGRTMPAQQAMDLAMAVASGAAPGDPERPQQIPLTPRERQVAALVASGRTNRQIGRVLGISEKTAEVHLHHVMSKLDVRSRAEVAAWAVAQHLSAPAGNRPRPIGADSSIGRMDPGSARSRGRVGVPRDFPYGPARAALAMMVAVHVVG